MPPDGELPITGRCYCGSTGLEVNERPQTVAYCHCSDCRRVTGAPMAAFAAFKNDSVRLIPARNPARPVTPGVTRRFCPDCGSQLTAEFDYLPDQIYVPIGILDQAANLPPEIHCHTNSRLSWLHINDDIERVRGSGLASLLSGLSK